MLLHLALVTALDMAPRCVGDTCLDATVDTAGWSCGEVFCEDIRPEGTARACRSTDGEWRVTSIQTTIATRNYPALLRATTADATDDGLHVQVKSEFIRVEDDDIIWFLLPGDCPSRLGRCQAIVRQVSTQTRCPELIGG
jgi:hypothetical protein